MLQYDWSRILIDTRVPDSTIDRDGPIIWNEALCKFYEHYDALPRLGDLWIRIDPSLMGGVVKFFKPNHAEKLQVGNRIIRVELVGSSACVLS